MSDKPRLDTLAVLTPEQLREYCQNRQSNSLHESYCFELFRRAIVEKSEQCWTALYEQYAKLVFHWVNEYTQSNAGLGNTPIEEVVSDAFTNFWRVYTPDKLERADGLASVLKYLKSCAVTAMLQVKRKAQKERLQTEWNQLVVDTHTVSSSLNPTAEDLALQQVSARRLWEVVDRCCINEKERIVARLSFVADLRPRAILEQHPQLFTSETEIYILRRNLKNRLQRNEIMREFWEGRN